MGRTWNFSYRMLSKLKTLVSFSSKSEKPDSVTASNAPMTSSSVVAKTEAAVARKLNPEELAGFSGTYAQFAKSREYADALVTIFKSGYRSRLEYHAKRIASSFFETLRDDPNELAASIKVFTDLLLDVRHSNVHAERNGIKSRIGVFDEFCFSVLARYHSLGSESRKNAFGGLSALYHNDG